MVRVFYSTISYMLICLNAEFSHQALLYLSNNYSSCCFILKSFMASSSFSLCLCWITTSNGCVAFGSDINSS